MPSASLLRHTASVSLRPFHYLPSRELFAAWTAACQHRRAATPPPHRTASLTTLTSMPPFSPHAAHFALRAADRRWKTLLRRAVAGDLITTLSGSGELAPHRYRGALAWKGDAAAFGRQCVAENTSLRGRGRASSLCYRPRRSATLYFSPVSLLFSARVHMPVSLFVPVLRCAAATAFVRRAERGAGDRTLPRRRDISILPDTCKRTALRRCVLLLPLYSFRRSASACLRRSLRRSQHFHFRLTRAKNTWRTCRTERATCP